MCIDGIFVLASEVEIPVLSKTYVESYTGMYYSLIKRNKNIFPCLSVHKHIVFNIDKDIELHMKLNKCNIMMPEQERIKCHPLLVGHQSRHQFDTFLIEKT